MRCWVNCAGWGCPASIKNGLASRIARLFWFWQLATLLCEPPYIQPPKLFSHTEKLIGSSFSFGEFFDVKRRHNCANYALFSEQCLLGLN